MSRKYIKPSGNSASLQVLSGIIGLVVVSAIFSKQGAPLSEDSKNYALVFYFICGATIVIGLINLFSKRGIPTQEVVSEDEEPPNLDKADVETRLRRLVRLHEDKLITDDEFQRKRSEILNEKW